MKSLGARFRSNCRFARRNWGPLSKASAESLEQLTREHHLSVARGHLLQIEGTWYVTHSGLLNVAARLGCDAMDVRPLREFCDPAARRWVFKATVYKSPGSKGFVGYGDADPSNTSPLVWGAEMRVAETRAVNRALRKAYGIGLCSVEEMGSSSGSSLPPRPGGRNGKATHGSNGSNHAPARLRDRLCLLIRQHELDPTLVKRYAADFCGTQELREASRDRVESFVAHLAESAAKDRDALVCKLNSYAQAQEVQP